MRLNVDDWQFLAPSTPGAAVAVNLFLDNGQQARLEISPLFYTNPTGEQIPEIVVTAQVTNTGDRAGTTVAQCYVRDVVASVARPVRELKGFERVSLEAGQSKTILFRLGPQEVSYLDDNGHEVLEPGRFQVWVGGDSNTDLGADFEITPDGRWVVIDKGE